MGLFTVALAIQLPPLGASTFMTYEAATTPYVPLLRRLLIKGARDLDAVLFCKSQNSKEHTPSVLFAINRRFASSAPFTFVARSGSFGSAAAAALAKSVLDFTAPQMTIIKIRITGIINFEFTNRIGIVWVSARSASVACVFPFS